jgi:hypothetical protein
MDHATPSASCCSSAAPLHWRRAVALSDAGVALALATPQGAVGTPLPRHRRSGEVDDRRWATGPRQARAWRVAADHRIRLAATLGPGSHSCVSLCFAVSVGLLAGVERLGLLWASIQPQPHDWDEHASSYRTRRYGGSRRQEAQRPRDHRSILTHHRDHDATAVVLLRTFGPGRQSIDFSDSSKCITVTRETAATKESGRRVSNAGARA